MRKQEITGRITISKWAFIGIILIGILETAAHWRAAPESNLLIHGLFLVVFVALSFLAGIARDYEGIMDTAKRLWKSYRKK